MVIVSGLSAWQYYQTPPAVRAAWDDLSGPDLIELFGETATPASDSPQVLRLPDGALRLLSENDARHFSFELKALAESYGRKNASEASRLVALRAFTDLCGVTFPVEVSVSAAHSFRPTRTIRPHRMRRLPSQRDLVSLGGGLFVTSPELTLAHLARSRSRVALLPHLFEACGTYAVFKPTARAQLALDRLLRDGTMDEMVQTARRLLPRAFWDVDGRALYRPAPACDIWEPCVDRFGTITDLWRRPPLTNLELLEAYLNRREMLHGAEAMRWAINYLCEGAASPLEAKMCILLVLHRRSGGECWPRPYMNMRIDLDGAAQRVAHRAYCVGDLVWPEQKVVLEVLGKAFHADKEGFEVETGRVPALEAMGCRVQEITYEQMEDLGRLETVLEVLSRKTSFALASRTASFIRKRSELNKTLFSRRA